MASACVTTREHAHRSRSVTYRAIAASSELGPSARGTRSSDASAASKLQLPDGQCLLACAALLEEQRRLRDFGFGEVTLQQ